MEFFKNMNEESIFKKVGVGRRIPSDTFFNAGDKMCKMIHREGIVVFGEDEKAKSVVTFPCCIPTCKLILTSLAEFEMHYNSCHRFICSQCKKSLPSAHLLDLHLSEIHDSFFEAQAERNFMYRCFIETCNHLSKTPDYRRQHCIEEHKFPPHDFRFDNHNKKNLKRKGDAKINEVEKMCIRDCDSDQNEDKHRVPKGKFTFGQSSVKGKVFIPRQCNEIYSKKNTNIQSKDNPKKIGELEDELNCSGQSSNDSAISLSELMDTLPPPV
ncbi:zinc finger protein 511-like isoform X1 [Lycorma delicatula]|uniref:zinc finger protein 511-like isoform X2 n=1 Tax=Lycorma delicatula TaxID=130591 RepID=UPI003F5199D4